MFKESLQQDVGKKNAFWRPGKIWLVALALLSSHFVKVALYKTYLQPDNIISAFVNMENIDMAPFFWQTAKGETFFGQEIVTTGQGITLN